MVALQHSKNTSIVHKLFRPLSCSLTEEPQLDVLRCLKIRIHPQPVPQVADHPSRPFHVSRLLLPPLLFRHSRSSGLLCGCLI